MRKRLVQVLVPLAGAAVFLLGLVGLGQAIKDWLRREPRYTIAFTDIDCLTPPGSERAGFLGEVQYLGRLPDRLNVLDEKLPQRLFEAFALHPWVVRVEQVRADPSNRVRVGLVLRTPVLAVFQPDGLRVVDGCAVLLPATAPAEGLPVLRAQVVPAGIAGRRWDDPCVARAAATALLLGPHQERLALTEIEIDANGLVLRASGLRILWGSAPGEERPYEASTAEKLERLLACCARPGRLASPQATLYDLRPRAGVFQRSHHPR